MHESCHSTELLRGGESPRVCGIQIATCDRRGRIRVVMWTLRRPVVTRLTWSLIVDHLAGKHPRAAELHRVQRDSNIRPYPPLPAGRLRSAAPMDSSKQSGTLDDVNREHILRTLQPDARRYYGSERGSPRDGAEFAFCRGRQHSNPSPVLAVD
jgi:hypothetical protein